MKKLFSIIGVILISCILFSGCADVTYYTLVSTEGKVEQGMQVYLDKDEITLAGYDYTKVFNKVVEDFDEYLYKLKTNVAYYASFRGTLISNCGVTVSGGSDGGSNQEQGIIYGSILFNSIAIYNDYWNFIELASGGSSGAEEDEDTDDILEKTWFYNKDINETETIFSNIISEENNVAKEYAEDYLTYFDGSLAGTTQKTLEDSTYNYVYGVPTNKIHSNSDLVYSLNGVTVHEWNFSASQLGDKIQTYTFAFKPTAWYILALVLTVFVILIVLIIGLIQKKIKKDKNTIAQEQK